MIDQYKSLSEKFLKKGFRLYFFWFIIAPLWYIVRIIISWELSVSEVWILYGILSLMTLLWAYNDFWMSESINHFLPQYVLKKRYDKVKTILTYAFLIQIITWIIIASFFLFWADFIAKSYFKSNDAIFILKIFAIYFLWINIFQIISIFFIAVQNTFYYKLISLLRMLFIFLSVVLVLFLDISSLLYFSYSWIIWLYIWILFSLYFFIKHYYNKYLKNEKIIWSKKLFKTIFNYAIFVFIWASASTILWQIDMQMVIYILWTTQAWYYTNYLSIISIPFLILGPILWLLFPVFSEMHAKKEYKKIKLVKQIFTKVFIIIWISFNIFFFIFAENISFVLFWENFINSWTILKYSVLFLIFNFLLQINFSLMAWIWKVKQRVKIIYIAVLFNFFANIFFINLIWVYWAALATWLGWVLIYILSEFFIWKKYFIELKYKYIFKNLIVISLLWIINYKYIIDLFTWLNRISSFWLLFVILIFWFIIFCIVNKTDLKYFYYEIKKLHKSKI